MDNNLNASKFKRMIKSKGFVTAVCAALAVVVLIVGYNIRINNATKPVRVPVASHTIQQKHQITAEDITYIEVPRNALNGRFIANANNIIGKYTNVNVIVPEGSLFYAETITSKDALPDKALYDLKEGETLYYLTVNMLTSYTNSIVPESYIDIYISTKADGLALVGKLLKNVKVLQVKTSDGKNVFDNNDESRVPYVILFALPEEQHLLMRKINAINSYSVASGTSGFARIDVIPVPVNTNLNGEDSEIKSTVSSEFLEKHILDRAMEIPEDVIDPNFVQDTQSQEGTATTTDPTVNPTE